METEFKNPFLGRERYNSGGLPLYQFTTFTFHIVRRRNVQLMMGVPHCAPCAPLTPGPAVTNISASPKPEPGT
jgi:hypothetical protein